jgi:hypothetical protein
VASSICLLFDLSATTFANSYVTYDADTFPQDNLIPYTFEQGGVGTANVSDGILTIDQTSQAGGLEYFRLDPLTYTDLAVFQFRARTTRIGMPSPGVISGAVALLQWTGSGQGAGAFFLSGNNVNLTSPGRQQKVAFDTTQFHTYTLLKNRNINFQVFIDGIQRYDVPVSHFASPDSIPVVPVEKFEGNPISTTEWDFVRYAIGDDALDKIPIPEPTTIFLACVAAISVVFRRSRL